MLRLAVLSARGRLGAFTGALIALFAAAVLSMAWGMQLESILRTHPPVERYASAAAVVTGQQKARVDHDVVLGERARGAAEYPELELARTTMIPVTAAFGGLAMFIAIFVVASTLGLSIQQREREIALLRAVAATPGQIRRMIAWEAGIVALVGSAAGIWPGIVLGRAIARGLLSHGITPPNDV